MPSTSIVTVDPDHPDPAVIAEAAKILRGGGLVAFATETVYGLGADATNPEAVASIFAAKGRPSTNPLIVHVEDKAGARACVSDWPDTADVLAERFWPGPLTLILPRSKIVPDIVTAGQDTVGVRVPNLGVARWLILETGRPIAAPSANRSMGISPTKANHVFDDLDGKVDLILDSGPTTVGIESTVLDLSGDNLRILRPGAITLEQIVALLDRDVKAGGHAPGPARSPGQMDVHYAPRTPAYRMERDQTSLGQVSGRFAVLMIGEWVEWSIGETSIPRETKYYRLAYPDDAAASLYAWLREIDAQGLEFLLIILPPDEPEWTAIRDRISRATRPWSDKDL